MTARQLLARTAPALLMLGAGCTTGSLPNAITGRWASEGAVMVAAGDSVTVNYGCFFLTVHQQLFVHDGVFTFAGHLGSFGFDRPGLVTISGSVSQSTVMFAMRPGIVDSITHYTLTANAPLPDWYPFGAICQA